MSPAGGVLGVIQAGGQGSRMDVLTRERAKPALPYAGSYQLVDFALSSFTHSSINDVWVSVQFQAGSLDPYLAGGRPWDLDRTRGGYRRVVAQQGEAASEEGFSGGNADDLLLMSAQIAALDPRQVVVMSADHVFRCDLDEVVDAHRERGAECTLVVAEVPKTEARHQGVVTANTRGRVTAYADKPSRPATPLVATEIFVYDTATLLALLGEIRADLSAADALEHGIGDFGDHLLPRLVDRGATWAHPIASYWHDVGRPEAYLQSHRDLLSGRVDVFDDPDRRVLSRFPEHPPARVGRGAQCADALLAPGCEVRGTVVDSVIGPGVTVEKGAVVEDCVIFGDVTIAAGARVASSIVDTGVHIGERARVGARSTRRKVRDTDVTLVGSDSRVGDGVSIDAGARLEPGTTA